MLFLVAALVATAVPAQAQIGDLGALGQLGGVRDLEALAKEALRGAPAPGVTVEKLDGGLVKVAVPLRADSPVLRQKLAKDLINCTLTVSLFEPDLIGDTVSYDVAPIDFFDYYLGWVTLNTSSGDITATTSMKTKGPGPDFNSGNQNIRYTGNAFNLFFGLQAGGWETGLHSLDVKVKGAKPGKLKGNFCAGCT